jgi:hypothetical protein
MLQGPTTRFRGLCIAFAFATANCAAEGGTSRGANDSGAAGAVFGTDAGADIGPGPIATDSGGTAMVPDASSNAGDASARATDAGNATNMDGAAGAILSPDLQFDSIISQTVLEKYLSRSISFTELLHDDVTQPVDARGADPRGNMRMLLASKAKFVGRAIFLWGHETNLPTFLQRAKPFADMLHSADPDIILQAAEFEIVTTEVQSIPVPASVLAEFSQPVATRNFVYSKMLFPNGKFVNNWGTGGSVPDMSQLETRMWFYFLATSYVDVGIEAIHFGQVSLMDQNDPGHAGWFDMLGRVRAYAHQHARRHMVLCDAHTPTGGIVEGGKLLFDSHAFPLRIAEVAGQPFKGVLQVGYADSIYTKSKGGITPSGWSCAHLPYLVEFDNFGSHNPGYASSAPFVWGWDEITWFATQAEPDRNAWLRYAWQWLHNNDPVAHLEMPGSRVLSPGSGGGPSWYWANTRSAACPNGFNTEATIRDIWGVGSPDGGM